MVHFIATLLTPARSQDPGRPRSPTRGQPPRWWTPSSTRASTSPPTDRRLSHSNSHWASNHRKVGVWLNLYKRLKRLVMIHIPFGILFQFFNWPLASKQFCNDDSNPVTSVKHHLTSIKLPSEFINVCLTYVVLTMFKGVVKLFFLSSLMD